MAEATPDDSIDPQDEPAPQAPAEPAPDVAPTPAPEPAPDLGPGEPAGGADELAEDEQRDHVWAHLQALISHAEQIPGGAKRGRVKARLKALAAALLGANAAFQEGT